MSSEPGFRVAVESDADVLLELMRRSKTQMIFEAPATVGPH